MFPALRFTCWSFNKWRTHYFEFFDTLNVCMRAYLSACLFVNLSVCLSICLSVWLATYLFFKLSTCQSVCLSACVSVFSLSACLSVNLSVFSFVRLSACLSFRLTVCLSIYMPILSIYIPVYRFVLLSVSLSACLIFCLSVNCEGWSQSKMMVNICKKCQNLQLKCQPKLKKHSTSFFANLNLNPMS